MKKFLVTIYAEPQVIEVEAEDFVEAEQLAWDMQEAFQPETAQAEEIEND